MVRIRFSFGSRHTGHLENIRKQRVKYPAVMKQVIDMSDIVLQIIDARFIQETRNLAIESDLKEQGKKLIYVCNKADLIDPKEVPSSILDSMKPYVFVSAKTKRGASTLRNRIKIEAKRVDIGDKKRVHVGVIGYPNAGKSSVINLIARRGTASISKHAGHTKGLQKIRLIEDVLLIDTPGVIPESLYASDDKQKRIRDTKLGARTYSNVRDPEIVVHALMQDHAQKIESFYEIESHADSEVLLEELGRKKKFLSKGGVVDTDRTARLVLRDWQDGKIM